MDTSFINDNNQEMNISGIMHSFAKTLPCRYEDIKENDIYGFSFKKKDESHEHESSSKGIVIHSPDKKMKVKPFIPRIDLHVSNKEILYSGHFGPSDNSRYSNDDTQPFATIQEENLNQSFLTTTSTNFTSFINSNKPNQKSFAKLCQNITIDKSKSKKKAFKSSEEIEIEKIQQEKNNIKKLNKRNNIVLQKSRSFNNGSKKVNAKGMSEAHLSQLPVNKSKSSINEGEFLLKKRERPFPLKSRSKSKVSNSQATIVKRNKKNKGEIDKLTMQFSSLGLNNSRSISRSVSPDDTSREKKIVKKYQVNTCQTSIRKSFNPLVSTEENQINLIKSYKFKSQPLNKEMFKQKMNIVTFDLLMQQASKEKKKLDLKELKAFKANREMKYKQAKMNKENIMKN